MALTPEDVVNKRFQPTKFREGYDQDEVDDFLDEVVVELRRLNQENEELRQRLLSGESRQGSQTSELSAPVTQSSSVPQTFMAEPAPVVAAPVVVAPIAVAAPITGSEQNAIDDGNTNNLLQLARKLHEEHVRDGVEKRDALIAEGHATAARVVSEAEAAQRSQISALNGEKVALEQQKTRVESQIDELRSFEREYRLKLKSYIEGQLHDLEATEPPAASMPAATTPATGPATADQGSYSPGSFGSVSSDAAPFGARTEDSFDGSPSGSNESNQTPPPTFQGFGGN